MTCMTVESAKGDRAKDEKGKVVIYERPKPGNYWLVPLAVVGDAITFPLQAVAVAIFIFGGSRC